LCSTGDIEAEHIPNGDASPESSMFPPEEMEATEVFAPAMIPRPARSQPVASPRDEPLPGRLGEDDAESARARIAQALEQCAGNQSRAAQLLGVSRRTLINHLERLSMPRPKKI
jgi:DNA-binding NtrC family response regulator